MVLFLSLFACITSLLLIIAGSVLAYKQKQELVHLSHEMERLRRDMRAVCAGSIGVGQRLNGLEDTLRGLKNRQDKAELREPEVASYAHATKLVEMGGSLEEVMVTCGLSRAEAELLFIMHQKERVIKPQYAA